MTRAQRRRRGAEDTGRMRLLALALIAGCLLVVAIGYLRPDPFADTRAVEAVFDGSAGVGVVGGEVRVAGAPVGEITGRRRVGDDAVIEMEIESDVDLRADAAAELRPRTAFEGSAYVELDPGGQSAGPLGDRPIPRSRTSGFVALDEALRFAAPRTRAALRHDVAALRRALAGEGGQGLRSALERSPALTRDLAVAARAARGPRGDELSSAVRALSGTVDAVAQEETELVPVLRGAAATLRALDPAPDASLDRALARLPGALESLDGGGDSLLRIVDRLDPLARELRPGLRELAPALSELRPLLREARPVVRRAPGVLDDLRLALRGGARSTPAAAGLLRSLDPSLRLLDTSLLPALERPTEIGVPAWLAFMGMFQGGGGASRAFQTEADGVSPGETGHFMRFGARFFTGAGFPAPPCDLLRRASPQLADQLSAGGGCTP